MARRLPDSTQHLRGLPARRIGDLPIAHKCNQSLDRLGALRSGRIKVLDPRSPLLDRQPVVTRRGFGLFLDLRIRIVGNASARGDEDGDTKPGSSLDRSPSARVFD
jgi:hypothetical protein